MTARTQINDYRVVVLVESNVAWVQVVVCEAECMQMLDCRFQFVFKHSLVKARCVVKKAMIQDSRESVERNASDVSTVDYITTIRHDVWVRVSSQLLKDVHFVKKYLRYERRLKFIQ